MFWCMGDICIFCRNSSPICMVWRRSRWGVVVCLLWWEAKPSQVFCFFNESAQLWTDCFAAVRSICQPDQRRHSISAAVRHWSASDSFWLLGRANRMGQAGPAFISVTQHQATFAFRLNPRWWCLLPNPMDQYFNSVCGRICGIGRLQLALR